MAYSVAIILWVLCFYVYVSFSYNEVVFNNTKQHKDQKQLFSSQESKKKLQQSFINSHHKLFNPPHHQLPHHQAQEQEKKKSISYQEENDKDRRTLLPNQKDQNFPLHSHHPSFKTNHHSNNNRNYDYPVNNYNQHNHHNNHNTNNNQNSNPSNHNNHNNPNNNNNTKKHKKPLDTAVFDELVATYMKERKIPGASIAVSKDGHFVLKKGYGRASREQLMSPWTLVKVGGVSKVLTSVVVMMMIQEGKLGLDDLVFGSDGILNHYELILPSKHPINHPSKHPSNHPSIHSIDNFPQKAQNKLSKNIFHNNYIYTHGLNHNSSKHKDIHKDTYKHKHTHKHTVMAVKDRKVLDLRVRHLLQHTSGWERQVTGDPILRPYIIKKGVGSGRGGARGRGGGNGDRADRRKNSSSKNNGRDEKNAWDDEQSGLDEEDNELHKRDQISFTDYNNSYESFQDNNISENDDEDNDDDYDGDEDGGNDDGGAGDDDDGGGGDDDGKNIECYTHTNTSHGVDDVIRDCRTRNGKRMKSQNNNKISTILEKRLNRKLKRYFRQKKLYNSYLNNSNDDISENNAENMTRKFKKFFKLLKREKKEPDDISNDEVVSYLLRTPLQHEPGTSYSYSNINYFLLGMVLEKVSGMSYEECSKEVFSRLGVKRMAVKGFESNEFDSRKVDYYKRVIAYRKKGGRKWKIPKVIKTTSLIRSLDTSLTASSCGWSASASDLVTIVDSIAKSLSSEDEGKMGDGLNGHGKKQNGLEVEFMREISDKNFESNYTKESSENLNAFVVEVSGYDNVDENEINVVQSFQQKQQKQLQLLQPSLKASYDRLSKESVESMFQMPSYLEGRNLSAWYGLGMVVEESGRVFWHSGNLEGATSLVYKDKDNFTWAVLLNCKLYPNDLIEFMKYAVRILKVVLIEKDGDSKERDKTGKRYDDEEWFSGGLKEVGLGSGSISEPYVHHNHRYRTNSVMNKRSTYDAVLTDENNQVRTMLREMEIHFFIRWLREEGYRPVWVDVFDADERRTKGRSRSNGGYRETSNRRGGYVGSGYKEKLYFNVIWTKNSKPSKDWKLYVDLVPARYRRKFDSSVAQGYRLNHLESYVKGKKLMYAALFVKDEWPDWVAYEGYTPTRHKSEFFKMMDKGFRLVVQSIIEFKNRLFVAAIYDKIYIGEGRVRMGLNLKEFSQELTKQASIGQIPSYVQTYSSRNRLRFSVIWSPRTSQQWAVSPSMTRYSLLNKMIDYSSIDLPLSCLAAYKYNFETFYVALWR